MAKDFIGVGEEGLNRMPDGGHFLFRIKNRGHFDDSTIQPLKTTNGLRTQKKEPAFTGSTTNQSSCLSIHSTNMAPAAICKV